MRSKALVLGARPVPWQGAWVSIEEAEQWSCHAVYNPVDGELNGEVVIEVEGHDGEITVPALGERFSGKRVRAVLQDAVSVIDVLSVFVKEERNG